MPNIEQAARWVVVTSSSDMETLKMCMEAAQEWYENSGVPRLENSSLYDLGVYQLTAHYYDNRGVINEVATRTGAAQLPLGVFSIMHQLRTTPPGSEANSP